MLMNKAEFWLMNNPIRSCLQRFEARRMFKMAPVQLDYVLEIGCGQGKGARLIHKLWKPKKYIGIDFDEKMVERARRNTPGLEFEQGDAAKLRFDDASFDGVIDFGIVHHIPNWKDAISEAYRVLKPGGYFVLEDLSIESFKIPILGWMLYKLLDHPYGDMYELEEFYRHIEEIGFEVIAERHNAFWFNLVLRK